MFHCVNCEHESNVFNAERSSTDNGVFAYKAKCPLCSSTMVNTLSGSYEENLRISITRK